MKFAPLSSAGGDEARLVRTAAAALLGLVVILALYFGRDVLIPTAMAILFAFILGPVLTQVRRLLPTSLAVTVVVVAALAVGGLLTVLVLSQLAEVAGSLTAYQANLQQKVTDIRDLSQQGGRAGQLISMSASLLHDLTMDTEATVAPAVRVQGGSSFAAVAGFVMPLLHPLLSVGIVVILVVFILLDRDHLSDQLVRLFGASDVHATSAALSDAAARVARVLSLQLLTNFGYSLLVGGTLYALGMPNAVLWGLLAGALRFVPYVGAALGAVLPTLIAFAVMPGWVQPFLVLGCIIAIDIVVGQVVEPLLFGESTGVSPLALILSAIFWGTLWGPIGLLLATPLTICLLVLGKHVPHLGFLQVLLGAEPALAPYQQIYRRLIRGAVADAAEVAAGEIELKGMDRGLDDGMGRMVVQADADHMLDRLSAPQIEAIVTGTDDVLEYLADAGESTGTDGDKAINVAHAAHLILVCRGGRGEIDDAAAAIIAFALRQRGLRAQCVRGSQRVESTASANAESNMVIGLACYASHPSEAVRRYIARKQRSTASMEVRHLVMDYNVAPSPIRFVPGDAGPRDVVAGDMPTLCRLVIEYAVAASSRPREPSRR